MPGNHAETFDPAVEDTQNFYKIMTGSVVPRPIAWVTSRSSEGVLNLAPFSFFTVASRQPATLAISIGPGIQERTGTVKDTLTNIRERGEFAINIVSCELGEKMQTSARSVAPEVDEAAEAGVTPYPSETIDIPLVQEAPIAFECVLDQIVPVGTDHLVLGRVQRAHVETAAYLGDHKIDLDSLNPLARLAGDYAGLTQRFFL
ncbi:flavin reductase family protein [Salibacterium halotolerans]|uniref:NADH-FMN oxidoreductase RutF, flavin reductase (DIM6/NTAB) family n=1 Tax=Salibacterium halotolerans TaxID=1884432 RepID=A0A1I5KYD0_9BACI|nr:flavin reductase family protein [Salibacterium halotolerans]SFO90069.1 NADH-FMN oxidoreductase RutF, flavin reductase (DIM6/NTAB) family [Salibacterium halotolerans]